MSTIIDPTPATQTASVKPERKRSKAAKAKKTKAAKPETKPTIEPSTTKAEPKIKVAKVEKASMSRALKEFVARDPCITVEELTAKLEAAGFKGRSKSTLQTLRSDAITTLEAAARVGLYTGEF
jgi:hypothetical protein